MLKIDAKSFADATQLTMRAMIHIFVLSVVEKFACSVKINLKSSKIAFGGNKIQLTFAAKIPRKPNMARNTRRGNCLARSALHAPNFFS
jgi:ribosomal protein L6P/L9E